MKTFQGFLWLLAAPALLLFVVGCGGNAPRAGDSALAEEGAAAAELEVRVVPEGAVPSDALRDEIGSTAQVAGEKAATADDDSPTLVFVNHTPSPVSFYLDGRGPYRLAGGASSYSPITISVGRHTIDTYDRNDNWVKRATLDAEAGMAYTYSVWVE